ncbi:MAG: dihydrolipoyl dehydrogenase [Candidatus Bathyarchaeota archaeon]|jgi:dihydrolipoamide dehydrogenase|nr:MAG: dihydrolipoyl dehydrogenase [Candidatus Bathyarchaeota archaeon]
MKEYDLISIGSGSAMNIVSVMVQENPQIKVAVIDKDEPGGICLTRGCIPSKMLLYPAELVRTIERSLEFGINADIKKINFRDVMERMRTIIHKDINMIRHGLSQSKNIDYYPAVAEFVSSYTLKVGNETITSKMIFLCTGTKPIIPPIKGLEEVEYLTSDTVLEMNRLPESIAIVGGGYIAAEYGHFFSAMGSKVIIIGRNPQFLKQEEPEVSALAKRELEKHMTILTNHEVRKVEKAPIGKKRLIAVNRGNGEETATTADEILVATGRGPNTDILHPEKAGIETDKKGWIVVDEYLETSQPNIWAFGDANGRHLFKHAANYESTVVYYNAVLKKKIEADYHAIPHAVFTYPEIGGVGLGQKEAIEKYGEEKVLVGMYRYENTAKGEAMGVKDYFVKVIVEKENMKILGAHIIGPHASVLIQEIVNLMYTAEQSARPITHGMHIHPALNEVVERAFRSLVPPEEYHHHIALH